ncbi:conserved hypothetical protein TIGR00252 [gamma proteobacterium HTCC5015]|nr:conserved hypothetical protein TIGR00252 [gamma proteobacterium HTCC5015]
MGELKEQLARRYLERQGLQHIDSNYNAPCGEIDLIMNEGNAALVFVEVRHRSQNRYGGAALSVDKRKQQRLQATAQHYLQAHPNRFASCRIDVIAIDGEQIRWIKNALDGF